MSRLPGSRQPRYTNVCGFVSASAIVALPDDALCVEEKLENYFGCFFISQLFHLFCVDVSGCRRDYLSSSQRLFVI